MVSCQALSASRPLASRSGSWSVTVVMPASRPGHTRRYIAHMGAEAKNFEAIVKAKADHNRHCPFPPHTVRMNPFEIERMGWEEGDTIAGLVLESDPKLGTGAFRLVCDG